MSEYKYDGGHPLEILVQDLLLGKLAASLTWLAVGSGFWGLGVSNGACSVYQTRLEMDWCPAAVVAAVTLTSWPVSCAQCPLLAKSLHTSA
jgi:hypothetical protein